MGNDSISLPYVHHSFLSYSSINKAGSTSYALGFVPPVREGHREQLHLLPCKARIVEQVTVDTERHLDARMAELLLDVLDILTGMDSQGGIGMSDAVKGDPSQLCFLQGRVEVPLDHVLVD